MLNIKVPINELKFTKSFEVFNNTWQYLIEQITENLNYVFRNKSETIIEFLEYIINKCYPNCNGNGKIIFAAVGRSLYMGAKTAAMRFSQLGFNIDFPHPSKEIAGPPGTESNIEKEDVIIAISTSGKTPYVVNKVNYSREIGCDIIPATATTKSPLTKGENKFIIEIPAKNNEEELLKKYGKDKVFAPMGTTSECTQMVFWELIGAGLNFLVKRLNEGKNLQKEDYEKAFSYINTVFEELLNNAQRHLIDCVASYKQPLKEFIANLIMFYYSNHTVHLYGRGKIFNVVISSFEMRLRQMPHGYITSIIKYAPKNRPIKPGQIVVLVSGSGGITTTAKKVKELSNQGCIVYGVSSVPLDHEFWEYADDIIRLEGRLKPRDGSWEEQQWEGQHADFAPEGFQFELNSCVLFESIFAAICDYIGIDEEQLKEGHANYE
ncbi:MAG: SIS domain-containing protein [Candidatus Lokiarchaeota archaeon]|nr:SIS domain-containing protein [Candidatus Lokiarchaeota archaeon]